jgi:pyruvate ferredoxin oxidoreductase gamma subunit/2-oxoisovalerate ferredoxin oxidoreductase gamma subunit
MPGHFPVSALNAGGAPVTAFCRIDNAPLRLRTNIYTPDIVLILDPSLLKAVDVIDGLKDRRALEQDVENEKL